MNPNTTQTGMFTCWSSTVNTTCGTTHNTIEKAEEHCVSLRSATFISLALLNLSVDKQDGWLFYKSLYGLFSPLRVTNRSGRKEFPTALGLLLDRQVFQGKVPKIGDCPQLLKDKGWDVVADLILTANSAQLPGEKADEATKRLASLFRTVVPGWWSTPLDTEDRWLKATKAGSMIVPSFSDKMLADLSVLPVPPEPVSPEPVSSEPNQDESDSLLNIGALANLVSKRMNLSVLEDRVEEKIKRLIDERVPSTLFVKTSDTSSVKISGHVHKQFKRTTQLAGIRENILLVGPAGSGKTTLAKQVADGLGLPFFAMSLSGGVTESAFKGRYVPSGAGGCFEFRSSPFISFYENGGVVLLDEFDACDENVLVSLNTALDNGYLDLPDRKEAPMATRHKDFVCIASANTYGAGANRMYCGRNALDGATLDRFQAGLIEMDYDKKLEKTLINDESFREAVWTLRSSVIKRKLRRLVSTRVAVRLDRQISSGIITKDQAIRQLQCGWTADEKQAVK